LQLPAEDVKGELGAHTGAPWSGLRKHENSSALTVRDCTGLVALVRLPPSLV